MTAAITITRKAIINTSTIGLTWLRLAVPEGTKVFHAWINAAGRRADDADGDDHRHAVANAAVGDLVAEPHQKHRARCQRQHRENLERQPLDTAPAECPTCVMASVDAQAGTDFRLGFSKDFESR